MTDLAEPAAPRAHARIVYLGPVSPHWEVYGDWGDRQALDEFRARVLARLVLLPREDPQFRRNRERIVRDAERELISIEWDLGVVTAPTTTRAPVAPAADDDGSESATTSESDDERADPQPADDGSGATGSPDASAPAPSDD